MNGMLQVVCKKFVNDPSSECRIECPGRHFEVSGQAALFLDGLTLAGSKVGSVVVEPLAMMIVIDSRWES